MYIQKYIQESEGMRVKTWEGEEGHRENGEKKSTLPDIFSYTQENLNNGYSLNE